MGKIYIGEHDKTAIVNKYIADNAVEKVYIIGDDLDVDFENKEHIKFSDTIMYKYFYRLLQEINGKSLIVLNECLKKQNRYDLTYNCIKCSLSTILSIKVCLNLFRFLPHIIQVMMMKEI